jgi:hypothetical protein
MLFGRSEAVQCSYCGSDQWSRRVYDRSDMCISFQSSEAERRLWICGLYQDWWLAPSYGCIYLHDMFSLVNTNILSRNETNLSIWTCLVDCGMGIRSFLLTKVSKYNNWSMDSCSMVLHSGNPYSFFLRSGNPYSLTAWSYTISSMFPSCMVLRSGDSCSLIAGYFTVTSMFLSSMVLHNSNPCFLDAWSYAVAIHVS